MSSNVNKHSTPNTEHNWEDLRILLKNHQTCTYDNHNLKSQGGMIFNPILTNGSS